MYQWISLSSLFSTTNQLPLREYLDAHRSWYRCVFVYLERNLTAVTQQSYYCSLWNTTIYGGKCRAWILSWSSSTVQSSQGIHCKPWSAPTVPIRWIGTLTECSSILGGLLPHQSMLLLACWAPDSIVVLILVLEALQFCTAHPSLNIVFILLCMGRVGPTVEDDVPQISCLSYE